MSDKICVGAIAGAFGTGGEVRLKSFCVPPEAIADYAPLYSDANPDGYSLTLGNPVSNGFAARLSGVKTREQAEALRGIQLFVDRARLPNLPDDEFYHVDLIGLSVSDTGGALLGTLKAVQNHGAGDLLEVQLDGQSATVLIPFTRTNVPTVDLAAGSLIVDPPEGLLPDD